MRVLVESIITIFPGKGLGPGMEMEVGDKLRSLVLSVMQIQEDTEHAHSYAREH